MSNVASGPDVRRRRVRRSGGQGDASLAGYRNDDVEQIDLGRTERETWLFRSNFKYQLNPAARLLGARGITLERSDESAKRLGPFADKHKRLVGYHNHAKVNFNSWDQLLVDAKFNAMNLDVGHYVAGTNESPIPLIKKYAGRILNLHLKDRKFNEGPNMPWGEGDTPLGEVLRLLRDEKYPFLAAIELEYKIPDDSDAVKEMAKCIDFCKEALG